MVLKLLFLKLRVSCSGSMKGKKVSIARLICLYSLSIGFVAILGCVEPKVAKDPEIDRDSQNPEDTSDAVDEEINDQTSLPDDWARKLSLSKLIEFLKQYYSDYDEILDAIEMLENLSAFERLDEKTKKLLILLVSGRNRSISVPVRKKLSQMENASDEVTFLLSLIEPTKRLFSLTKKSLADFVMQDEPQNVDIWPRSTRWKKTNGLKYALTLRYQGRSDLDKGFVYHSGVDQTGWIDPESAADAYTNLPYELAKLLPGVRISGFNDANGSSGGDGVIDLRSTNLNGFHRTFVHEASHSAWRLKGSKDFSLEDWQQAVDADGIYPSGYAKTNTAEHIAEVGVLYAQAQRSSYRHEYYALFYEQLKLFENSIIK